MPKPFMILYQNDDYVVRARSLGTDVIASRELQIATAAGWTSFYIDTRGEESRDLARGFVEDLIRAWGLGSFNGTSWVSK